MIVHIESGQREEYADLLAAYFRLRKTVFRDQLGWNVPVCGDHERDILDDLPCTYALSVGGDGTLNAGIRLIPTTQTTLLELAFDGLVPPQYNFRSPTIWELSRFCVNRDGPVGRLPAGLDFETLALTIANFDYARRNGITHYLTVTEERMIRLTSQFGVLTERLGGRVIDGCDVVCGLIPIDAQTTRLADRMRPFVERAIRSADPVMPAQPPSDTNATSHGRAPEASPTAREKAVVPTEEPQASPQCPTQPSARGS